MQLNGPSTANPHPSFASVAAASLATSRRPHTFGQSRANLEMGIVRLISRSLAHDLGSLLAQEVCVFACTLAHLLEGVAQPELVLGQAVGAIEMRAVVGAGAVMGMGMGVAVHMWVQVMRMRVLAMIMRLMLIKVGVVHVTIAGRID